MITMHEAEIFSQHHHRFVGESFWESVPVKGGGHTMFHIFSCPCGHIVPFPEYNFELITDEAREQILEHMGRGECP